VHFIDPSPTKQEVKWESQAEWREPSQRESKEAGGVQRIRNKKGSKNNKGEEDPGLKEKGKRQGEYRGSGTNRIQYY
jgi:hypothetical protein